MRAVITGGGTGGHIYPALAIADKIVEKEPGSEILYMGNEIGLEKDIVPSYGYPIELIPAMWIDRSNPIKIAKTFTTTMRGIRQAKSIMKRFRPDAVIGTGGYVCFPVIYAGHRYGAPCFIHEQNAYPGIANRSLERYVDKVFLGFGEAADYFRDSSKLVVTGNPVRAVFRNVDKIQARKKLGIPEDAFLVFSFGGSQGAEMINESVLGLCERIKEKKDIYLIFGTGSQYYDDIMARADSLGLSGSGNIIIKSYIEDMPDHIGASDLIICRCGALSVAEVCTLGRASIMIPSPNVTGNHQYFNARSVSDKGGSVLIEEKDLTEEVLAREVLRLAEDPGITENMGKIAGTCIPDDPAERIYDDIRVSMGRKDI